MTRIFIALLLAAAFNAAASNPSKSPVATTVEGAEKCIPNSGLIGEYRAKDGKSAMQATLLKDGRFLLARYAGGLPGAGWNGSKINSSTLDAEHLKDLLGDYDRVDRASPTLGNTAPAGALITFPDGLTNVEDGIMCAGGQTTKPLKSFHLHVEFLIPLNPTRNPSDRGRGNSGVFIFNHYEIQVLDTFGLDLHAENNAVEVQSQASQWCGSLYKLKTPDTNMAFPPLHWQTYDIDFHAPVFEGETPLKNARITVRHNGVLIHDDVELKIGTNNNNNNNASKPAPAEGPVFFQNYKSPVKYRNIWATEL